MSCIRILHRFEAQIERARERGAVLALVAVTLFIVLVSGALAVDISALDRQGQSLQNTADAAALAGVAEWVDSGDPVATRTVIEDLIRQNGFALGDEIEVEIDFLDGAALEVDLVDTEPDVFLGGVVGFGSEIGRDASARYEQCEIGCRQELELPPPFQPIHTIGSGDGFVPVSVGDRLYGVNHHSSTMSCVDRVTESQCFSDRPLFHGGRGTADNHYADVVGNRIYYVGWGGGQTVLQCWDTTVEERCGSEISFGFQGHSTMIIAPDNRIFVFTSSRKVFCVEAVTHATCAGYGGGRPTQLAELNSWSSSNNAAYKSYIAQHNGRIYHTLASGGRQHLHCWDTTSNDPCVGSQTPEANGGTNWHWAGRLFFNRDVDGEPISICSIGWHDVRCFRLDSLERMPSHEGKFSAFHDAHTEMSWRGWASMNTYHAPSNRLFAVNSNRSRTYCYDFNTDSYCGNAYNSSPTFGEIQTYGYIGEANCLIGLGDNSIFFSMKPDMSGPCDGSNGYVEVKPCLCSGKVVWPSVLTRNTERLSVFAVRVLDPADNVLLPNDGSEWVDLTGDGVLDLTGLDPTLQHLRVEVTAVASPGPDPWQDPSTVPTLVVGLRDEGPRLSE